MRTPSILASSAAFLLCILGTAVGQDTPKPAPELPQPVVAPGAESTSAAWAAKAKELELKAQSLQGIGPGTKPGVIQMHCAVALKEINQMQMAAFSASPEETAKMLTMVGTMRDTLAEIEARIRNLHSRPPASKLIAAGVIPTDAKGRAKPVGADEAAGEATSDAFEDLVRAEFERVKIILKPELKSELTANKLLTLTRQSKFGALGDRVGFARATYDGAKQRLEYVRLALRVGASSTEELTETAREFAEAEARLKVQVAAAAAEPPLAPGARRHPLKLILPEKAELFILEEK